MRVGGALDLPVYKAIDITDPHCKLAQSFVRDRVEATKIGKRERGRKLRVPVVGKIKMLRSIALFLVLIVASLACTSTSEPDIQPSATATIAATAPPATIAPTPTSCTLHNSLPTKPGELPFTEKLYAQPPEE